MHYWPDNVPGTPASPDSSAPSGRPDRPGPVPLPRLSFVLMLLAALLVLALQGSRSAGRSVPDRPGIARLSRLSPVAPPRGRLVSRTPLVADGLPAGMASARPRDHDLDPASPYRHDFVDLPCNLFQPTKAAPSQRASTITAVEQTNDGFFYAHGYTDFAQTYDLMVGGLQQDGVLMQDAVGIACASLRPELTATNIDWIEFHFMVSSTNNYPTESVGLVDMMDTQVIPHSQSTETAWEEWFYDARGLWGNIYFLDALSPGAYVIDLGSQAVLDMQSRVGTPGWFGVGMAADGWDLAGSPGQLVFNRSVGGGAAVPAQQPFYRVYYNSPPEPFALASPADGAHTSNARPQFVWGVACDPNFGDVVSYTLEYDVSPTFSSPVTVPGIQTTTFTPSVPLAASLTYWWRIRAVDSRRNARLCQQAFALTIDALSAVGEPPPPVGPRLGAPWPNPMTATLQVAVRPGEPTPLVVYDVLGRPVARVATAAAGGVLRWDGRTDQGSKAPAGTYYLVLGQGDSREVRSVRLVR